MDQEEALSTNMKPPLSRKGLAGLVYNLISSHICFWSDPYSVMKRAWPCAGDICKPPQRGGCAPEIWIQRHFTIQNLILFDCSTPNRIAPLSRSRSEEASGSLEPERDCRKSQSHHLIWILNTTCSGQCSKSRAELAWPVVTPVAPVNLSAFNKEQSVDNSVATRRGYPWSSRWNYRSTSDNFWRQQNLQGDPALFSARIVSW